MLFRGLLEPGHRLALALEQREARRAHRHREQDARRDALAIEVRAAQGAHRIVAEDDDGGGARGRIGRRQPPRGLAAREHREARGQHEDDGKHADTAQDAMHNPLLWNGGFY